MFRYGSDAGQFTEHVVHAAGGTIATAYCVSNLGIKVVAKRAAADSVIAMGSGSSSIPSAAVGSAAGSSAAAAGSQCNAGVTTTQDCSIPPAYSVDVPVNNVSPVDNVTPESAVAAVVSSAK